MSLESQKTVCQWLAEGDIWPCPIAHAEGRFVVKDQAVLDGLYARGQVALRYVTPDGGSASYPDCPNGAVDQIAAICDVTGRVLGLMPHPERNLTPWNHPRWTRMGERSEGEGLLFYRRMVEVAQAAVSGPSTAQAASAR